MNRMLSGVLLILLTLVGNVYAESASRFRSETVGLEIQKPLGWHFVTADENLENLKRTKLKDEEFRALMVKYATAPLVAMTKHKEPFDDLNPSLKINIRPLGQLQDKNPTEILGALTPQFKKAFKDFVIVQEPTRTKVSGLEAGYVRMNYSLQIPDGRSFPTTSELWVVPRGAYFFIIGAGTRQDEKSGSRKEIQSILESIRIDH